MGEYEPHKGPDVPLTRDEQDDLFRQMRLWLESGGLREQRMLACEIENVYRMKATILQLRDYGLAFQWLCDNQCHLSRDAALRPDCWVVDVDGIVLSRAESPLEAVLVAMRYCETAYGATHSPTKTPTTNAVRCAKCGRLVCPLCIVSTLHVQSQCSMCSAGP